MVMVTRSSFKKACGSFESSESSRSNTVPPWCSKGKVGKFKESKRDRRVASSAAVWEIHSAYPLRENIWEYLHEDKNNFFKRKSTTRCKQPAKKRGKTVICLVFLSAIVGVITYLWMFKQNTDTGLITWVMPKTTLISLFSLDYQTTSVDEECCSKMKHLAAALFRAERALRSTLRVRRTLMLASQTNGIESYKTIDGGYIEDIAVTKGDETHEWRSRVTMWGVVPLWRASPPPSTVLARRRPIPSDCWPFSGSEGELIFDLPSPMRVRYVSLEHVYPDTAFSAPRIFHIYGILANGTLLKAVDGEYKRNGPGKQYFLSILKDLPVQKYVFRVLSNQGNPMYTCIYRVHLYASDIDQIGKNYL